MWPDRRILDLFGIELPIVQAPMAGAVLADMAVAVAEAGGLGSLPCALLDAEGFRTQLGLIRQRTDRPINVNFFCHRPPAPDPGREAAWKARLAPYYRELGLDPAAPTPAGHRAPFDAAFCALVEELRPEVVSFHFGLPDAPLLDRVRATGAKVVSSATTVDEAVWLEERRLRRDHRPGLRGRRPPRHVPRRPRRGAGRHARAGAAGRRRRRACR